MEIKYANALNNALNDVMVRHGRALFRWRSYIPLVFLAPLLVAFEESALIEAGLSETAENAWIGFSLIVSLCGLAIRAFTVGFAPAGTSGRNVRSQRAERLNTTGMYSIARNPLYLGNYVMLLGVLLSIKVWWLALIVSMAYVIYMERIILAEEFYLQEKFGAAYRRYRDATPVILPDIRLWATPDLSFSFRTVLKREYPGLLGLMSAFFAADLITDVFFEGESLLHWLSEDNCWLTAYGLTLAFCLGLRYLKKHTHLLKVEGR